MTVVRNVEALIRINEMLEIAEWLDDPKKSPAFVIRGGDHLTPAMAIRQIVDGLRQNLEKEDNRMSNI